MSRNVHLSFMSGSRDGELVQVPTSGDPPSIVLGRVPDCDICLSEDPEVSRRHARLFWQDGWWLEDLRSSNGSFIGEFDHSERIYGPVPVSPGQIFRLGRTRIRLEKEILAADRLSALEVDEQQQQA